MSKVWLIEYARLGRDADGNPIPDVAEPSLRVQVADISGGYQTFAPLLDGTAIVVLTGDAPFVYKVGKTPIPDTGNCARVEVLTRFAVLVGKKLSVAVLLASTAPGTAPQQINLTGAPGVATQNVSYTFTPTVTGGSGTRTWALTGTLIDGLTFSTSTGTISGIPQFSGTATVTITASDLTGSSSLPVSLQVNPGAAGLPAAPLLSVVAGNGQNVLTFTDGSNGGSAITTHRLYRGTSSGALTLVGTISTGSPYTDTGLNNGTAYFYELTAINSAGEGPHSTQQSATPTAPGQTYTPSLAFNDARNSQYVAAI